MMIKVEELFENSIEEQLNLYNMVFQLQTEIEAWRRKHYKNPISDGLSTVFGVRDNGKLVAINAFMPMIICDKEKQVVVQSCESATNPLYRGKGYFRAIMQYAEEYYKKKGISAVFGFPNSISYPLFLRMGYASSFELQRCYIPNRMGTYLGVKNSLTRHIVDCTSNIFRIRATSFIDKKIELEEVKLGELSFIDKEQPGRVFYSRDYINWKLTPEHFAFYNVIIDSKVYSSVIVKKCTDGRVDIAYFENANDVIDFGIIASIINVISNIGTVIMMTIPYDKKNFIRRLGFFRRNTNYIVVKYLQNKKTCFNSYRFQAIDMDIIDA